jgi:hypothetical protein
MEVPMRLGRSVISASTFPENADGDAERTLIPCKVKNWAVYCLKNRI